MLDLLNGTRIKRPVDTGPGPKDIIKGTSTYGYFGICPAAEFFSTAELSTALGITEGAVINPTTDWFKFAHEGKVKFISVLPLRRSCSLAHLYRKGAMFPGSGPGPFPPLITGSVDQGVTVGKAGYRYDVHVFNATLSGTSADSATAEIGSEFRDLFLRVTTSYPTASDRWADYTATTLGMVNPHIYGWMRDTVTSQSRNYYRCHAGVSINPAGYGPAEDVRNIIGWRPVLQLV